jgi:hypothetical protein
MTEPALLMDLTVVNVMHREIGMLNCNINN